MEVATDIAENLARVRDEIAGAALRAGRDNSEIELIAVSKTWPAEVIRAAAAAGQSIFGENKVQEAIVKIPMLSTRLEWHLIGHLQKNKVRKILPFVSTIHSIDSLELALQVDRIAGELGLFPKVYLEVNIAGEGSKHGFSPGELRAEIDPLLDLDRLEVLGLMVIPPFDPDPELSRPHYIALRELKEELETNAGVPLPKLSMGMSHDFAVAIEEGATSVRVGTAIFGKRKNTIRAPGE